MSQLCHALISLLQVNVWKQKILTIEPQVKILNVGTCFICFESLVLEKRTFQDTKNV